MRTTWEAKSMRGDKTLRLAQSVIADTLALKASSRRICDEIAIARLREPLTDRRKFLRVLLSRISDGYRW